MDGLFLGQSVLVVDPFVSKTVERDVPLQEQYPVVVSAVHMAHYRESFPGVSVPVRVDSSSHLLSTSVMPRVTLRYMVTHGTNLALIASLG